MTFWLLAVSSWLLAGVFIAKSQKLKAKSLYLLEVFIREKRRLLIGGLGGFGVCGVLGALGVLGVLGVLGALGVLRVLGALRVLGVLQRFWESCRFRFDDVFYLTGR